MQAGQPSAIVDSGGRGDFQTVQAGLDYIEAVAVAGGPPGACYIRAGVYREVTRLRNCPEGFVQGESWGAVVDGADQGHALVVDSTSPRAVVQNLTCRTDQGGGNAYDALILNGANSWSRGCNIETSDQQGISIGGLGGISCGDYVQQADGWGTYQTALFTGVTGLYSVPSIYVNSNSDQFRITNSGIFPNAAGAITVVSGGDHGIIDSNSIDGTISNSGASSIVGDNETF